MVNTLGTLIMRSAFGTWMSVRNLYSPAKTCSAPPTRAEVRVTMSLQQQENMAVKATTSRNPQPIPIITVLAFHASEGMS